eukprot:m.104835 g.104835  ORF g.104835 m.104835 type:complete len:99 (+) comp13264_c1_seq1:434-730(+)
MMCNVVQNHGPMSHPCALPSAHPLSVPIVICSITHCALTLCRSATTSCPSTPSTCPDFIGCTTSHDGTTNKRATSHDGCSTNEWAATYDECSPYNYSG